MGLKVWAQRISFLTKAELIANLANPTSYSHILLPPTPSLFNPLPASIMSSKSERLNRVCVSEVTDKIFTHLVFLFFHAVACPCAAFRVFFSSITLLHLRATEQRKCNRSSSGFSKTCTRQIFNIPGASCFTA